MHTHMHNKIVSIRPHCLTAWKAESLVKESASTRNHISMIPNDTCICDAEDRKDLIAESSTIATGRNIRPILYNNYFKDLKT